MEKSVTKCSHLNTVVKSCPASGIKIRYFSPAEDLRVFIKYYWMVKVEDTGKFSKLAQISPSGYPELIFHFGDNISIDTSNKSSSNAATHSIIAGQITQSVYLQFNKNINCLCVKLQPYALKALFNIKSSEFTNRATNLEDICPKLQEDIYNQLSEAKNDDIRINIIDYHLRKLLSKNPDILNPVTCAVIDYLKNSNNLRIEKLEQIMDKSNRSLQRRIMEDVGMSPKMLMRIIRFNKVYHHLKHTRDFRLQDIAYNLGYYDLPHLINEFREFSGISPKKYFTKENVYNSLFTGIL